MAHLAIVSNPGRRKRRKSGGRKRRTAAQKAATRKMIAANRRRKGARTGRRRARKINPNAGTLMASNPKRRRRSSARKTHRRRRNPAGRGFNLNTFMKGTLMPSAIGAGGAIGLDLLLGFLPIPATLKVGPFRPVVRLAGAVGLGMLSGFIVNKRMSEQITAGAVTVVLYDTLKGFLKPMFPALALSEYEDMMGLGYEGAAQFSPDVGQLTDEVQAGDIGAYVDEMGVYTYEG